jgi:hypothetical protein
VGISMRRTTPASQRKHLDGLARQQLLGHLVEAPAAAKVSLTPPQLLLGEEGGPGQLEALLRCTGEDRAMIRVWSCLNPP